MGNFIKKLVYTLLFLFVLILVFFAISVIIDVAKNFFIFLGFLGLLFFVLGGILIYLVFKKKIRGKQRIFLLLTGFSSAGVLFFSVLHNFLYALAVVSKEIIILKYLFEFLHGTSFIISLLICPVVFVIGIIGSIILTQ
jgi:hypothetical protein